MKNEILDDITGYIDFLRMSGYFVMLSCFDECFGDILPTLLEYEVHCVPICAYLKSYPRLMKRCVNNKRMLTEKAPENPYYSCCYAGVEEYVYPITDGGKIIMCVNISGYRGNTEKSKKLSRLVSRYCGADFDTLYGSLSDEPVDAQMIEKMIRPMEYMIKRLHAACEKENSYMSESRKIFTRALKFIYDNYMSNISCGDVAAAVSYSEAYLRRVFKKECGISIMKYINKVRCEQAEYMLRTTDLGITEIAYSCGFSDSNYFSTAFKNFSGVCPKKYRG